MVIQLNFEFKNPKKNRIWDSGLDFGFNEIYDFFGFGFWIFLGSDYGFLDVIKYSG